MKNEHESMKRARLMNSRVGGNDYVNMRRLCGRSWTIFTTGHVLICGRPGHI